MGDEEFVSISSNSDKAPRVSWTCAQCAARRARTREKLSRSGERRRGKRKRRRRKGTEEVSTALTVTVIRRQDERASLERKLARTVRRKRDEAGVAMRKRKGRPATKVDTAQKASLTRMQWRRTTR